MVSREKVWIASSIEPSGVTWLLNCLLSLDILCYRDGSPKATWNIHGEDFTLRPEQEELKRWIPVLESESPFKFANVLECEWTHEFADISLIENKVILFTRDPRGSILSRYKRDYLKLSMKQFLELINPNSMLAVPDNLNAFYKSWLTKSDPLIVRFEDYKENPQATLEKVLSFLDIKVSETMIQSVCLESSFEKAAESERRYLDARGIRTERLMNRAGSVKEWEKDFELQSVKEIIEMACWESLTALNYALDADVKPQASQEFTINVFKKIRIAHILLQEYYSRDVKMKLFQNLSSSTYLKRQRKFAFLLLGSLFKVYLTTDEVIKLFYLKLKYLFSSVE